MIRTIMISILTILLIGFGVWGYKEHQEKQALLIQAENNYQRAFHNLTYQMDVLNEKIGSSLAMNSQKSLSPTLADVWRITSEARGELGQLPLSIMPFNKTEEFLATIGNFTYRTAVRNLDNHPLSDDEYTFLNQLYEKSKEIKTELRSVQHKVVTNDLRWMDIELALALNEEPGDNTIIDGFKTVEKKVEGYDEEIFDQIDTLGFQNQENNFEHLKGEKISEKEALNISKQLAGVENITQSQVTKNADGAKYPFYSVNLDDDAGNQISVELTEKAGYPIWFINHREIGEQKISLNDAEQKAKEYLETFNFLNMEAVDSVQYDTIGLFTFVTAQDDVLIYPEVIKLKVALDDGQIIGFTASDYLKGKNDRKINQPTLTAKEAEEGLNEKVKWSEGRLAIIQNELHEEVLCYEFYGTLNHDTYQVYINADTGLEEKVEKLQNAEVQYEAAL